MPIETISLFPPFIVLTPVCMCPTTLIALMTLLLLLFGRLTTQHSPTPCTLVVVVNLTERQMRLLATFPPTVVCTCLSFVLGVMATACRLSRVSVRVTRLASTLVCTSVMENGTPRLIKHLASLVTRGRLEMVVFTRFIPPACLGCPVTLVRTPLSPCGCGPWK